MCPLMTAIVSCSITCPGEPRKSARVTDTKLKWSSPYSVLKEEGPRPT